MDSTDMAQGRRRRRRNPAIPKDDPRRQELLTKGFLQEGYIEGLPDVPPQAQPQETVAQPQDEGIGSEEPVNVMEDAEPNDTGSMLDPMWASELIGENVPDYVEHDDLVVIGGNAWEGDYAQDAWEGDYAPGQAPSDMEYEASQPDNDYAPIPEYPQMPMPTGNEMPGEMANEEFMGAYDGQPMPVAFGENGAQNMMTDTPPMAPPMPPQPMPTPPMPEPTPEPEHHRERHHRPGRIVRTMKRILFLIMLVAMFVGGFAAGTMYEQQQHPTVSAAFIATQLSECSDLATAKIHYNGLVHYEDGDIPLINKKTFSMTYQAEVRAGVDLSQADVKVSNGEIVVTLPKATVQTTSIDPSSVQFFDQTWGLFSWESKDDAKTALEQAQKDLEKNMDDLRLIDEANMNAERAIRGLIAPTLKMNDGYKLTIKTAAE